MPVLFEDFQSFAIGATSPFGSLTGQGSIANGATPDGLIGPYGQDRFLIENAGGVAFSDGVARTSGSIFCSFMLPTQLFTDFLIQTWSGAALSGYPSLNVRVNADGTISLTDQLNFPFATTTRALRLNVWYYLQVNCSFSVGTGGHYVIDYSLTIDGDELLSGTYQTSSGLGSPWWMSTVWETLPSIGFSNIGIDTLQSPGFVQTPGSPIARVTAQVIEVIGKITAQPWIVYEA